MLLLAFGQTYFKLDFAGLVVHIQRHQRITSAFRFANEPFNFLRVQQQLASTDRVRIDMGGGGRQRTDMTANEKQFAITDYDVCFFYLYPSRADRFDLPTFENHAGFIFFLDKIIVKSFLILNDTHVGRKKVSSTRVSCILTAFNTVSVNQGSLSYG